MVDAPVAALLALPSLVALASYATAALLPQLEGPWLRASLLVAWLAHAVSIAVDTSGLGAQPAGARFGFAPALSVTLWLVIGVYLVESRTLPLTGVRRSLALLGATAVMLAMVFPGERAPHALSRWAPLHWIMGIASYGLFGAAVLHAAMLTRRIGRCARRRNVKTKRRAARSAAAAAGAPL